MKTVKINKHYTHFCVSKATGKIVDGWTYGYYLDKESITEYYKMDMRDNDRPVKDYRLLTAKFLLSKSINPFDQVNWGNN